MLATSASVDLSQVVIAAGLQFRPGCPQGKKLLPLATPIVRHCASNVSFINSHPDPVTHGNIGRTLDDPTNPVERYGITAAENGQRR
jgi:hypothetical protein